MYATAKSLGIDRLSLAERILLVEEIWDSIAAEADALEVPQSQRQGWDEAFRVLAEQADDRLLDEDVAAQTDWDTTEWQW